MSHLSWPLSLGISWISVVKPEGGRKWDTKGWDKNLKGYWDVMLQGRVALSSNHSIELGVVNSGSNQADVNIQGMRYGSWGIIGGPRHGDTWHHMDDYIHRSSNCLPVIHSFIHSKKKKNLSGIYLLWYCARHLEY